MQRIRMSALLILCVVLLLILAPTALAQPGRPNPVAPQLTATIAPPAEQPARVFLPLLFHETLRPVTPQVAFWASRYTLPEGGCATLSWHVVGASGVWLDGAPTTLTGTQEACPFNTQFYTLEAQFGGPVGVRAAAPQGGIVEIREVILTAGDPMLSAAEVVAQAKVSQIASAADIDPQTAGDQPGYRVGLDGARPLYTGTPGWKQAQVTLGVPLAAIDFGAGGPVHWPLRAGQNVEFRAACDGAACLLDYTTWHYLYMTSE